MPQKKPPKPPKPPKAHYVPSEPIAEYLRAWFREAELESAGGEGMHHPEKGRYFSPYKLMVERTGLDPTTIYKHVKGERAWIDFDMADKILVAIGKPEAWWQDPVLKRVYARACKGADLTSPIGLDETPREKINRLARERGRRKKAA